MQEEEHQRSLREQRRQRIHREQAEAEQRSRQRWEEMREAQLREQVRAEVYKEAEEMIHSGIEAGVWDRISQAHAQGSGLPLLLQLLVNMGQILTQLTQDRADTKEFFLSQVRHQSHQLAELQQAHSRMIGQLTQLLQNQLARDLGRAPPAAPASPRPLAAPASPRPPAALASPRPPAAAASPRAPAAPASPRLAAPSTAGPSSGTPAGFGGAATPQAMKRLPKDTTGKILRCGACHGCFTVETNPKSRAHCVQWRQELQDLADEAKAEESEEKEQKKSKKRKKKDKKLMVEEPDRVSLPDRDRDGDKDKGPDGDGSAQGSALKKSRLARSLDHDDLKGERRDSTNTTRRSGPFLLQVAAAGTSLCLVVGDVPACLLSGMEEPKKEEVKVEPVKFVYYIDGHQVFIDELWWRRLSPDAIFIEGVKAGLRATPVPPNDEEAL
ncbi:hypothetical protein AK812_SmicGene44232 [Symbiodinium microadriaticum]|uniref:Uncharacterized protein n=1 Tax=Symbiodinium microadriaticum TaxID=2951 RepID=A0A1Q9BYZ8_SYMMI|nr:hypothetical protein AK812_SmicGene44232 [Symbiodinium microadriaticum]